MDDTPRPPFLANKEDPSARIAALEVEIRNAVNALDRLANRHSELDHALRDSSDRQTRALSDLAEKFARSLQDVTDKSATEMRAIKEGSAVELKAIRESALKREDFIWLRGVVTTAISALVTAGITWLVLGPHH